MGSLTKGSSGVSGGFSKSMPLNRLTGIGGSGNPGGLLGTSNVSRSFSKDKFQTKELINTMDVAHYFIPLFYAGERGAMGIWEKKIGQGHIKRRQEDVSRKHHVLEIINPNTNTGTYIAAPSFPWKALHLTLPHCVLVLKNFKRNFSFEVLILDNKGFRRRLVFATWFNPGNLRKYPFLAQIPLKLDVGWNEVHVDLRELTNAVYRTKYVETLRIQVHANCRLRQIFFCSDEIINQEKTVPSMRGFDNVRILSSDFGPFNHPDYNERREQAIGFSVLIPEIPAHHPPTRMEKDLKFLHRQRYNELITNRMIHPLRIPGGSTDLPGSEASRISNVANSPIEDWEMPLGMTLSLGAGGALEALEEEGPQFGAKIPLDLESRPVGLMQIIEGKKIIAFEGASQAKMEIGTNFGTNFGPSFGRSVEDGRNVEDQQSNPSSSVHQLDTDGYKPLSSRLLSVSSDIPDFYYQAASPDKSHTRLN